jgi:AcrR family transcriptional regulator
LAPVETKAVRADAQRNRERLVEAARRAFASGEHKATLEGIARDAGVGIGTLYRHFPTREALVEAVYRAELARLCDSAAELLADLEPDAALRAWMDRFAGYVAAKRDMADTLRVIVAAGTITSSQARERLAASVQVLLDAGVAAGTLRDDVLAQDVVVSLAGRADDGPADGWTAPRRLKPQRLSRGTWSQFGPGGYRARDVLRCRRSRARWLSVVFALNAASMAWSARVPRPGSRPI